MDPSADEMKARPHSLAVFNESAEDQNKFDVIIDKIVSHILCISNAEGNIPRDSGARYQVNRTYSSVILEMHEVSDRTQLCELYSPFGGVKLPPQSGIRIYEIGEKFLKSFDWSIEDVTDRLVYYFYYQEHDQVRGPWRGRKEPYLGAGGESKFYLVRRVGEVTVFEGDLPSELPYFRELVLTDEQCEVEVSHASTRRWPRTKSE